MQGGSRAYNRISTGISRTPTIWPDRQMCKMRYVDSSTPSVTSNTPNNGYCLVVNYRVNSLYDPQVAIASEQALAGFAEMSQMYNKYRVHAVKVTVDLQSTTSAPLTILWNYANESAGATTYATMMNLIGNPYSTWATCASAAGTQLGSQAAHIENYCKISKIVGTTNVATDTSYSGTSNTNPYNEVFGTLYIGSGIATAQLSYCPIVQLEFWCEWYDRDLEIT